MAKKAPKAKEPVRIRLKKLANGNQSIYLDIYIDGRRQYEFLKLYLIPESTPFDREQNKQTMQAANAIKSQRVIELASGGAGIRNAQRGKMLLVDWLTEYKREAEGKSEGWHSVIRRATAMVVEYAGDKTRLCDIDKEFCSGYLYHIANVYRTRNGKKLESVTCRNLYRALNSAINEAVRRELMEKNPFQTMGMGDRIKVNQSQRIYLTIDEVRAMAKTPCSNTAVKSAYLFSVYSGLRISDIERLTWGNIETDGEHTRLNIVQKKTKNPLYLPLSKEALKCLPNRGGAAANERVFHLPTRAYIAKVLRQWAAAAGIQKHVTFHTARHTNATMLLTLGADLYTVSKLLGHTEVRTTQIYAKIVDKKKEAAVSLLDNIFND